MTAMLRQGPHRQSRRDRLPHHPHAAPWASRSVAVYSDADALAPHVREADEAVAIGGAPARRRAICDAERILEAARDSGAEAIHPGYGFLSENADFAAAVRARGHRVHRARRPTQIRDVRPEAPGARDRRGARRPAAAGHPALCASAEAAVAAAQRIGYPVMLKSTAGGGGIGMRVCREPGRARRRPSKRSSGSARRTSAERGVFLERFVERARHVEVQIFGDGQGEIVALGERDCSVQRRNQKVIEETPAPGLPQATRERLHRRREPPGAGR